MAGNQSEFQLIISTIYNTTTSDQARKAMGQVDDAMNRNVQQMKKVGKGYEEVSRTFRNYRGPHGKMQADFVNTNQVFKDNTGLMRTMNRTFVRTADGLTELKKENVDTTESFNKMAKSQKGVIANNLALAARAIAVIPVWMALRAAYSGVIKAIGGIITAHRELDEGMTKVMAVAGATADTQVKIYADLENAARQYFSNTSRSMKEVTEGMYQLGTAGRSAEEMMVGFQHVMNLAIGTFGSVKDAGKTLSGVLNVFEGQLKKLGSSTLQMEYVADLLADAWKNNQVELTEMTTAMSYLGSIGGALNIDLKELVATSSVMSDAMLRGGKGGRLISRALVEISKSSGKLRDLGVLFDPNAPLEYYDVMRQIHDLYEQQGGSMSFLTDLIEVFGTRGGRAVLNLMQQWEKFNKELGRTPDQIKGTAAELKELAESSTWQLITRAWRQMWVGPARGTGVSGFKNILMESLKPSVELRSNLEKLAVVIDVMGDSLKFSREQAIDLYYTLKNLGQLKEAGEIYKQIPGGIGPMEQFKRTKWMEMPGLPGLPTFLPQMGRAGVQYKTGEGDEQVKEKAALYDDMAFAQDAIKQAEKEITEEKEKGIKAGEKVLTQQEKRDQLLKGLALNYKNFDLIQQKSMDNIASILGIHKESYEVRKRAVKLLVELHAAEEGINAELTIQQELQLMNMANASKYNKMRNEGLKESTVLSEEIEDSVYSYNEGIKKTIEYQNQSATEQKKWLINISDIYAKDAEKLKTHKAFWSVITTMIQKAYKLEEALAKESGKLTAKQVEQLQIQRQLSIAKASGLMTTQELIQLEIELISHADALYNANQKNYKIEQLITKQKAEQAKYGAKLKDMLSDSLKDVFSGETGFEGFLDSMSSKMHEAMMSQFTENLSATFIEQTGMGEWFGGLMGTIADAFKTPEQKMKEAVTSALEDGGPKLKAGVVDGAVEGGEILKENIIQGLEEGSIHLEKEGVLSDEDTYKIHRGPEGGGLFGGMEGTTADLRREIAGEKVEPLSPGMENIFEGITGRTEENTHVTDDNTLALEDLTESIIATSKFGTGELGGKKAGGIGGFLGGIMNMFKGGGKDGGGLLGGIMKMFGGGGGKGGGGIINSLMGMIGGGKSGGGILGGLGKMLGGKGGMGGGPLGAIMGGMSLANMYKMKGSGNIMGGLTKGATSGMQVGSMFGPVGSVIGAIGGGIFGAFKAGQSKTVTEAGQSFTNKVAPKIDVTNKQLEIVNRNLVAMRQELSYIMQESYYFSAKRGNLEDEFSLDSRR